MPDDRQFPRGLPPTMLIGFLLLTAMVVVSLLLATRISANATETVRLSEYRRSITDLMAATRDAETGQRGYLLTGKEQYLVPYMQARARLGPLLGEIADGNTRGLIVAGQLRPQIAAKLAELAQTIALEHGKLHDQALAVVETDRGKQVMDSIRVIGEGERRWVLARTADLSDRSLLAVQQLTAALIGGGVAIVILALFWLRRTREQLAVVMRSRGEAVAALSALKNESAAREESEAQVRQLQKMESLGQLTGGIAHDFNNMLAVVIGSIELAKRRLRSDPDRADQQLDNAFEGATRAAALTARLLAFSRRQPLAPTPLDANKLVGGMSEMLSRTLGDAIRVETVFAAGLWRCYADSGEIENAILNLAVNARDAMPDGGRLTIETACAHIDDNYARSRTEVTAGQYVVIAVTDTGSGMAPEVVERAFDPFFTTKDVGKGTGLGLSQVFGFAKQSGGHVAIYSEPGEGTTVKLYLPRFHGKDDAVSAKAQVGAMPEGDSSEIILVVEDEQRVRHFAVDVLRELGYTALSAGSPSEALQILSQHPSITMLFTDIVMPDLSGRKLADLALEQRPELKVLFTTGYTRNAVVHNGMLDVGVAFLPKPYTIGDLARKVRDVLDGGGVNRTI